MNTNIYAIRIWFGAGKPAAWVKDRSAMELLEDAMITVNRLRGEEAPEFICAMCPARSSFMCADTHCGNYTIIDMELMPLVEATLKQLREGATDS